MKLYTILKNLWKSARNYSDANLQIAKDYTDEGLTIKPYDLTITNGTIESNQAFTLSNVAMGEIAWKMSVSAYTWTTVGKTNMKPATTIYVGVFTRYDAKWIGMLRIKNDGVIEIDSTVALTSRSLSATLCYFFVGGVILNLLNNRRVVFA